MRGLWLFIHVIGFTLWLGGGIATMIAGVSAKSFEPGPRLAAYKLIGNIQRVLVGPGAIAVVLSGIVLAMPYMRSEEHTSELQSQSNLVCRLLLEKKKKKIQLTTQIARHALSTH